MDTKGADKRLDEIHEALIGTLAEPGGLLGEMKQIRQQLESHVNNTALYRKDLNDKLEAVGTRVDKVEVAMVTIKADEEKKKAFAKGKQIGLLAGASTAGAGLVKIFENLWPKP